MELEILHAAGPSSVSGSRFQQGVASNRHALFIAYPRGGLSGLWSVQLPPFCLQL